MPSVLIAIPSEMNSGVFLLYIALVIQGLQVDATQVEVWLHSYRNPDHTLANGICCYSDCADCNSRVIVRNISRVRMQRLGTYAAGGDDVIFGMQIGNLSNPFTCTTAGVIRVTVRHVYMPRGKQPAVVAQFNLAVNETYECYRSYHGLENTNASIEMSYRTVQATQSSVMDLCKCTSSNSNKGISPALTGSLSALALIIIIVALSVIAVAIGLWKILSKQKQKQESPSKPQPNTRAGPASWHNVVYTPSDSSPGMPGGHTQSTRAPPSASYHEYDLIDQGGATVCIKLNSDSRVKAPTSTGTAEENYSTPADALTDGGFTAKKGCNHKYAELNAYPVKQ